MQIYFNGGEIDLKNFASAHTNGDTAVFFKKQNAVHLGDVFNNSGYPFIDVGSVWGLENPAYGSIDDKHEARSSIGVNFNWDSAIGPINIIYANIIKSNKNDTTDNLYFDIGYNF